MFTETEPLSYTPRSGQRLSALGLSTTLRCTIRRVTLTCDRCAAIGLNLRWSNRLTMRHINLRTHPQRTGKVHADQISIAAPEGGGNRIHRNDRLGSVYTPGLFTTPDAPADASPGAALTDSLRLLG